MAVVHRPLNANIAPRLRTIRNSTPAFLPTSAAHGPAAFTTKEARTSSVSPVLRSVARNPLTRPSSRWKPSTRW
jgi:hypothetical protein